MSLSLKINLQHNLHQLNAPEKSAASTSVPETTRPAHKLGHRMPPLRRQKPDDKKKKMQFKKMFDRYVCADHFQGLTDWLFA